MNEKSELLRQVIVQAIRAPYNIRQYISDAGFSSLPSFWVALAEVIYAMHRKEIVGKELQEWLDAGLERFLDDVFNLGYVFANAVLAKIREIAMESNPEDWIPELRVVLLRGYLNNIHPGLYTPEELQANRVIAAIALGSLELYSLHLTNLHSVDTMVKNYRLAWMADLQGQSGHDS